MRDNIQKMANCPRFRYAPSRLLATLHLGYSLNSNIRVYTMLRKIFLGLITITLCVNSAYCLERREFDSLDAFVKSFKQAEIGLQAEGDLMGKGRADWAGQITTTNEQDYKETQIYILEKLASGKYAVVEKTIPRAAFGGTGNWYFEGLEIKNKSLFIDFSYQWHQCSGHALSQFKLYKNVWRMIGVRSDNRVGSDDGTEILVSSDTNLITGDKIIKESENDKEHSEHFKIKPKIALFKDYSDAGSLIEGGC